MREYKKGCFSFTANFDAIGRFFTLKNGFFLHSSQDCDFKVSLFSIFSSSDNINNNNSINNNNNNYYLTINNFPIMRKEYRTQIDDFGPSHYFAIYESSYSSRNLIRKFQVKKHRIPAQIERTLNLIFAQLRLSGHDPDLFYNYKDLLKDLLDDFEDKDKLERELYRVWANYYFIPAYTTDVPFALGEVLFSSFLIIYFITH